MRKVRYVSRLHMLASLVPGSETNDSFEFKCRRLARYDMACIIERAMEGEEPAASLTATGERICYCIRKFAEQHGLELEYDESTVL